MMFNRTLVAAVRELMERHWNVNEIATRIGVSPDLVAYIVAFINNSML